MDLSYYKEIVKDDRLPPICDFNINEYWEYKSIQLPRLSAYAMEVLSIPVTSADAERSFSLYNKIVTEKRSLISDEVARSIIMLNYNK